MTMLNYWERIIRGRWRRGLSANTAAFSTGALPPGNPELDAEPRITLRKTRRKPKSKPESAEVAESAETDYWDGIIRGRWRRGLSANTSAFSTGALPPGNPELDAEPRSTLRKTRSVGHDARGGLERETRRERAS